MLTTELGFVFWIKKIGNERKMGSSIYGKNRTHKTLFFQFVKAAFASTTPHFYFTYYQQKKNLRKLNVPH
jgi:hypothetical protein